MHNIRQYQVPLQRYMAMMDLQVINYVFHVIKLLTCRNKKVFTCFGLCWPLSDMLASSLSHSHLVGEK